MMRRLTIDRKFALKHSRDARIVLLAVAFSAAAWLGQLFKFADTMTAPAWPPAGVAFALLVLLGRHAWPGIVIGSLLSGFLAPWMLAAGSVENAVVLSASMALAYTGEALAGTWLLKNWIGEDFPFTTSKSAFRFLFLAVIMCLVGALISNVALYACQVIGTGELLQSGISWLVGDLVGVLLFAPFLLCIVRRESVSFSRDKLLEVALMALGGMAIVLLLRVEYFSDTLQRALPFLILPFFMWLAFRFELFVAVSGVLLVSLLAMWFTVHGQGPFVLGAHHDSMLLLQIFACVMSVSTLVLSATVKERTEAQNKLRLFNETLEANVQERTKALNDEIGTRRDAEVRLKKTNDELSKRNMELDNFVYSVSHDLRAPIASVLGLINLARQDKDLRMKDTYLEMINKSALQQDHFIREILDQSRNSRLEVRREQIQFEPIIEETFSQLSFATSTGKAVEKVIEVRQNRPFYCDRWRLKVILNNIISNAIRYRNGRDPVIKVNVEVNGKAAHVSIEDNGKGIAPQHLKKVCQMFYRATDDGAGSGLGLYIVKEAVDKLNGSIDIDSTVDVGTKVRLVIPEVAEKR